MNYIQAENISKGYGEKVLFSNLSFSISQGDKIALIANNGSGKTTILHILAGIEKPDMGQCTYRSGLRIAYLKQKPDFDPGQTVSEALLNDGSEISNVIREYEECIHSGKFKEHQDSADTARLQYLIDKMDALGAWDIEQKIEQVLTFLQIDNLTMEVGLLSGGQQKRLSLARILIEDADLLLLDEPTNHLDLDMIEWLEGVLKRRKQTLLLVTHDRYFLDSVCNVIMELDQGIIHTYKGNYAYFTEKKQERLNLESRTKEKAANLLRIETEWMRRSPQARTTKSKARIEAYHDLEANARKLSESKMERIQVDMARMGKKIIEANNISISYGNQTIINDFSYVFKRGERMGIVGPNGCGKSTLLNIITGLTKPDHGTVETGETIRYGYYRQEGIQVNEDKRVLDVITEIAEHISLDGRQSLSATQLLSMFNFSTSSQYDRVENLSGGEKRRLYLLTVLMNNPNFLILDEPTNDFDINTLNVLEEYLLSFHGCLLIVSHDRYFLDRVVDQLLVFETGGRLKGFTGNYTEYRIRRNREPDITAKRDKEKKIKSISEKAERLQKISYKEQKELDALELNIASLEEEKVHLLQQMNQGSMTADALKEASERYAVIDRELEEKSMRWFELEEKRQI